MKYRAASVTKDIMPLSEFKTNASSVLNSVKETGRSVIITQNGKPACVVIPTEEYDKLVEQEAFMSAVAQGIKDVKAGRGRTSDTKDVEIFISSRYRESK